MAKRKTDPVEGCQFVYTGRHWSGGGVKGRKCLRVEEEHCGLGYTVCTEMLGTDGHSCVGKVHHPFHRPKKLNS